MKGQLSSGRETVVVIVFVAVSTLIAWAFTKCASNRTPAPLSVPSGLPRAT